MPHYGAQYLSGAFLSFLTGGLADRVCGRRGENATPTQYPIRRLNTTSETRSKWSGTQSGSCIPRYLKVISYGT
jgi:hypothetical protein